MRLIVAAVGRLKDDAEREMSERYQKRFNGAGRSLGLGPLEIIELVEARKSDEAQRLLKAASAATLKIALDEGGRHYASDAFAKLLRKQADTGVKACAFLIGGPDGHGPEVFQAADFKLSLSAMTMPHGLARVVLLEQLYRAATILSGHPYHRS